MQHLNTLWQAVNMASSVTELARQSQTFHFNVKGAVTFYLQAESAEVRITRWNESKIEVMAQVQAAFGWRMETDQDDAGVYVVARRRLVVGTLSSAVFSVLVPQSTYLILKLTDGRVTLNHIDGTIQVPPANAGGEIVLK
jgi:hypothetical protein